MRMFDGVRECFTDRKDEFVQFPAVDVKPVSKCNDLIADAFPESRVRRNANFQRLHRLVARMFLRKTATHPHQYVPPSVLPKTGRTKQSATKTYRNLFAREPPGVL